MISFYNSEVDRSVETASGFTPSTDAKKISWDGTLKSDLKKQKRGTFAADKVVPIYYRPFQPQWMYFDRQFNNSVYQMHELFPSADQENRTICVTGVGEAKGFSALMSGRMTEHKFHYNSQCFPLRLATSATEEGNDLFAGAGSSHRDGISDWGYEFFASRYQNADFSKEDLFYYIYGLLHSPEYRERFKNNLPKELPRIPAVRNFDSFWAFSQAGRELGDLHVGFDMADAYPVVVKEGDLRLADIPDPEVFYRVEKMKFGGKGKEKDKSVVHYNPRITMTEIPLRAYDYVVNGKPALEWVMERQCVKTDKASGIVNDANRYAVESVGDPAYPLKLFQRVITVSLRTLDIVESLPELDID